MTKLVATPEVTTVALASLVRMISLLGAELVVGSGRCDIDQLEQNVRAKLHASVNGIAPEATATGVTLAHILVEPVLRDLRARATAAPSPSKSAEAVVAIAMLH